MASKVNSQSDDHIFIKHHPKTKTRLCDAIKANTPEKPIKFVVMNTAGNSNRDLNEQIPFTQKFIGLLRLLLPLYVDNKEAADYLRSKIGQKDKLIEWVAVRPDNLTNEDEITAVTNWGNRSNRAGNGDGLAHVALIRNVGEQKIRQIRIRGAPVSRHHVRFFHLIGSDCGVLHQLCGPRNRPIQIIRHHNLLQPTHIERAVNDLFNQ